MKWLPYKCFDCDLLYCHRGIHEQEAQVESMCKHPDGHIFILLLTIPPFKTPQLSFLGCNTYLLFRGGDILETEKINLLNCRTGNHLVHLVTINTISFDHGMWKCVSPEESTTASSLSRSYYTELQPFPLSPFPSSATRPLSIDTAEIIFPFWKRGPFPKYMSFSPGNVQHVFSFYFLVVSVLF